MATTRTQSQFRRHLSFLVLVGCLIGLVAPPARAAYEPARGGPFFLLSDSSYGSGDEAKVRFEAVDQGAIAGYGGADVHVYRIPKPLDFLQKQRNLYRVQVDGNYAGEGLANALRRIWDDWYVQSRQTWRGLFSFDARAQAVRQAPELGIRPGFAAPTRFRQDPQYKPIPGFELVDSFRYPVHLAQPIQPPADVKLAGSSSEFIQAPAGNVMIPLGKRRPGLYLVEAMVGQFRATTLVFVADTVAVTKVSAAQMLVWTAGRQNGQPVAKTQVRWIDGTGVLQSGSTDSRGVAVFERNAPEQTYVVGEDPKGGVFISENFYYDSEIYNAKLYAVTDRPLYRPGDQVFIKIMGRDFGSARESRPVPAGELQFEVLDPNGLPVAKQKIALSAERGADTSFRLPDNAAAGGYDIRFEYKGDRYGAAFRVAEYQKPHFEIAVLPDKSSVRTGEAVTGRIQLAYPDGKPVTEANVEISVRAQQMTMVDGDLGYSGQFPVKLTHTTLTTDKKGIATYALPPARDPSRYVLTVLASDGAAYRVKATKEILVERGVSAYTLKARRQFSTAGEAVAFDIAPVGEAVDKPARWEWVRLENRQRGEGRIEDAKQLNVAFPSAGSYTLTLRDDKGNVIAAASHFVGGAGAKAPAGSIAIVFDKAEYRPGDTAEALLTFPTEVPEALVTLERDKVEKSALLSAGSDWLKLEKQTPTQWRARLPVHGDYGPNITLSVAYAKDGDYVFQNQGLKVEQPRIQLEYRYAKPVYAPGEMVEVDVQASLAGKPVAATVAVGVVDEMIYVLQPEIAPDIFDFFYHPRRNNVRTGASLGFIGYDLATPRTGKGPSRRQVHERALKVMERPRRDEVDTAYWNPSLVTNAQGKAHFSFRMPDSLTRWRITGRAMDGAGTVGQRSAWLRSEKSVYVKWTSPDWLRSGDAPQASVALFNQTSTEQAVEVVVQGAGAERRQSLKLKPGINFMTLPLEHSGSAPMVLAVRQGGQVLDSLEVPLHREPLAWPAVRSLAVPLAGAQTPLSLPADATRVRLRFAGSADELLARVADDLIDYPYGCVEQTASRLIPLTLAIQALGDREGPAGLLRQRLYSQRFRLAQMAGPNAVFGWWGDMTGEDPFLTAYAYFADWQASRALGLVLPQEHWDRLMETYAKKGYKLPPLQRALALNWMAEMGLPVRSLVEALGDDLAALKSPATGRAKAGDSLTFVEPEDRVAVAAARLLASHTARQAGAKIGAGLAATAGADADALKAVNQPFENALLLLVGKSATMTPEQILAAAGPAMPTFERAMTLVWVHRALGGRLGRDTASATPAAPWQKVTTVSGRPAWVLPAGSALPKSLVVSGAPAGKLTAFIDFESRAAETQSLPVKIERRLYRLEPRATKREEKVEEATGRSRPTSSGDNISFSVEFDLQPVVPGSAVHTDALYLDELVLRPESGQTLHYGLIEAALPPGATVERGTWGVNLRRLGAEAQAMEKARQENTRYGYAVPVDVLAKETTVRHLVRFAEKGSFQLPPVRFHRMYQPEQKAFEGRDKAWTALRVE